MDRQEEATRSFARVEEQAKALVETAQRAAAVILAQAEQEAVRRQQAGYDAGRQEGYVVGEAAGRAFWQQAEDALSQDRQSLVEKDRALLSEAEGEITRLVLLVANRVIGQKLRTDDQCVQSSLKQVLGSALRAREALVQAASGDFDHLWAKRQEWTASIPGLKQFDLQVDPNLTKGDLVLVTNQGTIDARVETILEQVADQLGAGGE